MNLPYTPHIPSTNNHVRFPLFRSYQRTSLWQRYVFIFRNKVSFYGEELLATRPTPKLEDHPLSADRDCVFNIFEAALPIGGGSSIRNLRTRNAVVMGTHLSRLKNQDHRKFSELRIICLRRKKKCIVDTFVSSLRTKSASITESTFITFQGFKQLLTKLFFLWLSLTCND